MPKNKTPEETIGKYLGVGLCDRCLEIGLIMIPLNNLCTDCGFELCKDKDMYEAIAFVANGIKKTDRYDELRKEAAKLYTR